jgi:hypothetical protein
MRLDPSVLLSMYINTKEMTISHCNKIKNVKGNIEVRGGKIIGGAGIAVAGDDTTMAMNVKDLPASDDCLISLSVSNAGEFLKVFGITETVKGGNINIAVKSPKGKGDSVSAAFEVSDFIVDNNNNLAKLMSLSSVTVLPTSNNLSVGFNACSGSAIITGEQVRIENVKAYGPTTAISLSGSYDRVKDEWLASGLSLPTSSLWSKGNSSNTILCADFDLTGSLERPLISVKPLRPRRISFLMNLFGSAISPVLAQVSYDSENSGMDSAGSMDYDIAPSGLTADAKDPFAAKAFDNKSSDDHKASADSQDPISSDINRSGLLQHGSVVTENIEQTVNEKFGIVVNRGAKNRRH